MTRSPRSRRPHRSQVTTRLTVGQVTARAESARHEAELRRAAWNAKISVMTRFGILFSNLARPMAMLLSRTKSYSTLVYPVQASKFPLISEIRKHSRPSRRYIGPGMATRRTWYCSPKTMRHIGRQNSGKIPIIDDLMKDDIHAGRGLPTFRGSQEL